MTLPSRSIIVAVLVIAAMTVYVAALSMRHQSAKAHAMTSSQSKTFQRPEPELYASPATCGTGPASHTPVNALNHIQILARSLAEQKRYAEAFAQFHNIAAIDPGFPGVNLDISLSLLQLKDTAGAKDAIDSQIAMSDCLMKLPPELLQTYCKAEGLDTKSDSCSQRLQTIRQTAYFQAALVQMELGHAVTAEPVIKTAKALPAPPTHTEAPAGGPLRHKAADVIAGTTGIVKPAKPKLVTSVKSDSLVSGAGTDSNLGAYSK